MPDKIIQLNAGVIKQELGELVRTTVVQLLNKLLDQEADRLTKAGEVSLKVPKLRTLTFESSII